MVKLKGGDITDIYPTLTFSRVSNFDNPVTFLYDIPNSIYK